MVKIVNIAGEAQHGKTTSANILKEILETRGKSVLLINYADYLKFICREYFGWDGTKSQEGRTILQRIGTDIVRKKNPDFWVKVVGDFVKMFGEDFDYIITSDCRFRNEANYFKFDYSVLNVKVVRVDFDNGLTKEQKNHPSEKDLEGYNFDAFVFSLDGIDELKKGVEELSNHMFFTHDYTYVKE